MRTSGVDDYRMSHMGKLIVHNVLSNSTATATTATATTTPTAATTPTATPSLFQQLWKKCKGLHSVFSPCGSSALSEESTENQAKPAYSSPLASSIISEVTAAAIHNAPVDARATQLKNAKFNITQIPWERIYTPKSKPVKKHFNAQRGDQGGFWRADGTTNGDPRPSARMYVLIGLNAPTSHSQV
ncbi:hypothetical protein BASA83_011773 [Batrachochytrium salamandrivorans]|nr:hypothetical protein BASA83_011773 [Batrachochytrium salamandrivorans]